MTESAPESSEKPFEPTPEQVEANRRAATAVTQRTIIEAVNKIRGRRPMMCPICAHADWSMGEGYVNLSLSPLPGQLHLGGAAFPLVALICRTCGNTQLLNVYRLGFSKEEVATMPMYPPDPK